MEVQCRSLRGTYSSTASFGAVLSDPKHFMHKTMTKSLSYDNAFSHKPSGIDVKITVALHDRILSTINLQKVQECRAASIRSVEDGERAMKVDWVIKHSSSDTQRETFTFSPISGRWRVGKIGKYCRNRTRKGHNWVDCCRDVWGWSPVVLSAFKWWTKAGGGHYY